jgi:magnesium-transporting ATPase (P-type)
METAISIAHTCRLLNPGMAVLRVREDDLRSGRGPSEIWSLGASAAPPGGAGGVGPAGGIRGFARRLLGGRRPTVGRMVYGAGSGAAPAGAGSSDAVARAVAALRAAAASGRLLAAGRAATGTVGNGAAAAAQQQQQQQQQQLAAPVGLVIDGAALALALQPAHEGEFLDLCRSCAAVVCCRVSPMQKAQVGVLVCIAQ